MEKLALKPYGWKCVLGGEALYALCLGSGLVLARSAAAVELHHLLFETLPGFTWINLGSVILGAAYVFIGSWIFAWYYVWMHNSSLVRK